MKNGFVTLIGLLIVTLLIGIWFVNMYSSSDGKKAQTETYNTSIQKAEDVKNVLERKNQEY
jgi:hypothetical protein